MHKKFYNFMLPVLGAAVVVGSGFSAWVFSDTSVPDTLSGTFSITDEVANLKVEIKKAGTDTDLTEFALTLDQGGITNAKDKSVGITSTVTSYDIKVSYETVYGLEKLLTNSELTLSYTVAITSTDSVTTYFDLTDGLAKQSASDVVVDTYNADMSSGTIHKWSSVPLTWTYVDKPDSKEDYDAMTTALSSGEFTLTVTVSATWADK